MIPRLLAVPDTSACRRETGVLCLVLGLLVAGAASAVAAERPNVILVMSDDQGYGELSCHGNPVLQTPHLDRLHQESARLTDFHVAPMCTPTRGQLMTGLDAFHNGAMNVSSGRTLLRPELPTMADFFAKTGYRTAMFGKWHLGDNYPFRPQDRGFQESIWFPSSHINSVPDYWDNDYFDDTYFHNGRREAFSGYCTDVFFTEAMRWIEASAGGSKPFFVYLPLNAPHSPHFVPPGYREPIKEALQKALPQFPELTPGQQTALVSFLAMIANIDENMGRLEDFLKKTGRRDNTILIFLTDNGSTMGPRYFNAGMKGGKVTLWEGGHRVPCFVRWPAGKLLAARDIAELTHVQDLLPTLIDLCGLDVSGAPRFDGTSLAGILRGEQKSLPDRMLVVNYSRMPLNTTRPTPVNAATPKREGAAVLWKRWRLLEDRELYDLQSDFHQDKNVIAEFPEVAAKMRAHLDAWWDGLKDSVNVPQRVVIGTEQEDPSLLTACEWFDVFVDQQRQVRRADLKNGVWHLNVARPGRYEFRLRRWPAETDLALTASLPETQVTDGVYVAGTSLPIRSARIRIGDQEQSVKTSPADQAATFRVTLDRGPTILQTWFFDDQEKEICGAYYVEVERLEAAR
ncbi:MAG: arylsulfatase [Planctomycetaceae bacterium]|nr:arylsulfatase [Planctomycetaceae bacterium]